VNLSIKNVPDQLAKRLRQRAARSHRSIQGELLAILEEALAPGDRMDARQVLDHVRGLGLKTAAEAQAIIRADRDAR
jgi:plasmid stability protein